MDMVKLRPLLRNRVTCLSGHYTHNMIPEVCQRLGLPVPDREGTKAERMTRAFDASPDGNLRKTAERLLEHHALPARERNELQDLLWEDLPTPQITKRIRREIARVLADADLYRDGRRFDELLDRLWVLDDNLDALNIFLSNGAYQNRLPGRRNLTQYVHKNPGDWPAEVLFDELGAYDCSDTRFALFLEGLASADVLLDEPAQRQFVALVNGPLRDAGAELRETDSKDGYPVFTLVSTHSSAPGRPKNLIFASQVKPDLRFRDAINNDVEIVTNADKVLVYDRPIGTEGITWKHLQSWWEETNGITDKIEARKTLYNRLLASLPQNSPPQRLLFTSYLKRFDGAVPDLPAMLPEVWLHWDPKTVSQRGRDALLRFRMDFLLLLPGGARVVIEVDGKHHYADDDGKARPERYAEMVAADRDLKLAGYHVFRFGAAELPDKSAASVVGSFFEALFKQFAVAIP